MKIEGKANLSDYLSAQYLHRKVFLLVAGIATIIINCVPNHKMFHGIEYSYLVAIWFIFYSFVYIPLRTYLTFLKIRNQSVVYEIELTDQGLYYSSELGSGTVAWKCFSHFAENNKVILLYQDRRPSSVIPKHYFKSAESLVEFKNLLVQYMLKNS